MTGSKKINFEGGERLKTVLGLVGGGMMAGAFFLGMIVEMDLIGFPMQIGIAGLVGLIAALVINTHYAESNSLGITVHTGKTKFFLKWKDIDRYEVRDGNFIIMDELKAYRIPMEIFKPGQEDALKNMLRAGMGRDESMGFDPSMHSYSDSGQQQSGEEEYF